MASWPVDLPAPLINTIVETPPENTIRTQMEVGPAKVRRRTTANVRPLRFSITCTPTQAAALDTFYTATTSGGADEFDYSHPRTGDSVSARFTQAPTYSDVNGQAYRIDIALEIMP